MSGLDFNLVGDRLLHLRALAAGRSQVRGWWGLRNTPSKRSYMCYVCGRIIDTDSTRNAPTRHAAIAVADHGGFHLLEEIGTEELQRMQTTAAELAIRLVHTGAQS